MTARFFLQACVCLLLSSHIPTAESARPLTSIKKRYYHHKVELDSSKHNDEFFSFVTARHSDALQHVSSFANGNQRPDLDAPRWNISILNEELVSPGYWFLAPYSELSQSKADAPWNAPHIYDSYGNLIWSGAPIFDGFTTFDFRVINMRGEAMLSLIYPRRGRAYIFDNAYQIHKILELGDEQLRENEIGLNAHEFTTIENGTKALYLTRLLKKTSKENSELVNFDGECFAIFDGIQEMDTETWKSTNRWNSENLIGLDESYATRDPVDDRCTARKGWDFFHANSIDTFPNGDYLVSGRRTSTIYRVSRSNGTVLWRLGGRKSDFKLPIVFSGQHAAKIHECDGPRITISLLDNAFLQLGDPQTTANESRGLLLNLNTDTKEVHVKSLFHPPEGQYTKSRGNVQMLPNNNAWISWTHGSLSSEHSPDGALIMKTRFRADIASYRTYKFSWVGTPADPPDVHSAIVEKNDQWYTIVHMSWNGATEVRDWAVYHTDAKGGAKRLLTRIPKHGFETRAWLAGYATHVVVEALDENGNSLRESEIFASLPPRGHHHLAFPPGTPYQTGAVARNSIPVFTSGIVIGALLGLMISILARSDAISHYIAKGASWKRSKVGYRPLITRVEEERYAVEGLRDHDEPERRSKCYERTNT